MYKIDEPEAEWRMCINWRIFLLLLLLCLVCYSNTFNVSFHFDDLHNITQNTKLHIDNLYPGTIYDALFGDSGKKKFYRPVSNLSIALNWYFGKTDVTGYHIVNLGIHILTAFFLYLTMVNLFSSPNLAGRFRGDEYFIAILAATLWAVNPIQTQAVTYIVQRMAAMTALFYIMGIYFYVKARICHHRHKKIRILFFSGVLISFFLAIGSKENAILLPLSLFLLEVIFFKKTSDPQTRKKLILTGMIITVFIMVSGFVFFLNGGGVESILNGYNVRTFTISERILTEFRVLIFYLTQIFYPIADRLSLDHEIVLSTGFFSPWTTLPAIFCVLMLIVIAVWQIKKTPLLSFAILFFFLNHVVESSVIALELIFEHRNYLPSLFLFLPIASGLKWLINYYTEKKIMAMSLICFSTILIIMLGMGTYIRNMAWADGKTLWEDTLEKAPGKARPYQNLATSYYARIGDHERIMALLEKAMYLSDSTRHKAEVISLSNMANIYAQQRKDFEKAIQIYHQILVIDSKNDLARYNLALSLIRAGRMTDAMEFVDQLLTTKPESAVNLNLKAFILLKQKDLENALIYIKKAIKLSPDDRKTLRNIGVYKIMTHEYDSAEHFLKRLRGPFNKNITALFLLIENSIKSGKIQKAETYADNLISEFSATQIIKALTQNAEDELEWPVATNLIAPVITKSMINKSNAIKDCGK